MKLISFLPVSPSLPLCTPLFASPYVTLPSAKFLPHHLRTLLLQAYCPLSRPIRAPESPFFFLFGRQAPSHFFFSHPESAPFLPGNSFEIRPWLLTISFPRFLSLDYVTLFDHKIFFSSPLLGFSQYQGESPRNISSQSSPWRLFSLVFSCSSFLFAAVTLLKIADRFLAGIGYPLGGANFLDALWGLLLSPEIFLPCGFPR